MKPRFRRYAFWSFVGVPLVVYQARGVPIDCACTPRLAFERPAPVLPPEPEKWEVWERPPLTTASAASSSGSTVRLSGIARMTPARAYGRLTFAAPSTLP